jgi:biotin carboxylase
MKHILILGAGLMQKPAIDSAHELGCHVTVVDGNPNALCASLADVFYPVDLKNLEELEKVAGKMKTTHGIDAVFTAGTDFTASVSYLTELFGLPGHSLEAAKNASDKVRMRSCFKKEGVPSPEFTEVTKEKAFLSLEKLLPAASFPVVVKPCDNMGARGCRMVRSPEELEPALFDAISFSRTGRAILEEYMDGPEFSIDSLVFNGEHTITGFADRHIFYPPYFIEMGHTMPTSISEEVYNELLETFNRGVKALGLSHGAAKADIKMTKKGAMIGEIAGRLSGGYMSGWTYLYSSELNLTKQGILLALGENPSELITHRENTKFSHIFDYKCSKASAERAWISIPGVAKTIHNLDSLLKMPSIKNVFPRTVPGDKVSFPVNNVEKSGNVISQASTVSDAISASEKAIKKIFIELEKNNTETNAFLNAPLNTEFPPSAFMVNKDIMSIITNQKNDTFTQRPSWVDKVLDLTDWNKRTLGETLELYNKIKPEVKQRAEKSGKFWYYVIRGGIQGALYFE